ncbi:MAG TPA: hypothetical protein VFH15_14475 [Pyrinomonadaceae bacterium]|nr:hypothetical protein [Pyrinomonadaceae bacterium]
MTIAELIHRFRDAAIKKADGVGGEEDAAFHLRMESAFHGLMEQGDPGREAFRELLHDDSPYVRGWVAAQLLCESDAQARLVLQSLRKMPGVVGFDADMVLREDLAGRLMPPFGSRGA